MKTGTQAMLVLLSAAACGSADTVAGHSASTQLTELGAGNPRARPFWGFCNLTVTARVHDHQEGDEGDDEGGCGGDQHEPGGGSPPIPRHYDLQGSCVLMLLGLTQVSGRLNLTGPFGPELHPDGHTALAARGRLAFAAAAGDTVVGRYVPIQAVFVAADGDGGTVTFTSREEINQACEGHGGGGGGGGGGCESLAGETCEQPVSTGRFVEATGSATLLGAFRIYQSSHSGAGTIYLKEGILIY